MAKADDMKVSLEQAIHKTMREFAMNYYKEHGVMIDCINFEWIKSMGGNNLIYEVNVETSTNG